MEMSAALDEPGEGEGVVELVGKNQMCTVAGDLVEGADVSCQLPFANCPGERTVDPEEPNIARNSQPGTRHSLDQPAIPASDVHDRAHCALIAAHKLADEVAESERKNGAEGRCGDEIGPSSDRIFWPRVVPRLRVIEG